MSDETILSLDEVESLATRALCGVGTSETNAEAVARSTKLAERDGIRSHGLMYIPIYAEHVKCGKVNGRASPVVDLPKPGAVVVDAANGFAHPAIDAGWDAFTDAARSQGVSVLTTHNSYNCGVLGHHAKRIAEDGLLGLCFTHAPASIAPQGGNKPVVGTNPFALAVPDGEGRVVLAIDQSASVIAKSEIMLRNRMNEPIEADWAFDKHGQPTTSAADALEGTMAPIGGYKGFGIGLTVEVLAACLSGAVLSKDASPFAGPKGGPPSTGQCFIAFDPRAFSGDRFAENIQGLVVAISEQEGAHLPGDKAKRKSTEISKNGTAVANSLIEQIEGYC